jgi:hypothetical protein
MAKGASSAKRTNRVIALFTVLAFIGTGLVADAHVATLTKVDTYTFPDFTGYGSPSSSKPKT